MKPRATWKVPFLIGVLAVVALLINFFFYTRALARREARAKEKRQIAALREAKAEEDRTAAAEAKAKQATEKAAEDKKAAEEARQAEARAQEEKEIKDAVTEHNRLVARYVNSGFKPKPGIASIGVAIESEQGTMNPAIGNALAQRFESSNVHLLSGFFKPDFVADKSVANLFSGDTGILDQLDLTNCLNGILIGRQTITYSTNPALENTITANLHLEVMSLPVGHTGQSHSWALSATGAGFNNFEARAQAEERMIHRIATDSTLSLTDPTTFK